MKKMGGFFIWEMILLCGCDFAPGITWSVGSDSLPDDCCKTVVEDLGPVSNDQEPKSAWNYLAIESENDQQQVSFFYPETWDVSKKEFPKASRQRLIAVLGNFEIDDLFHPNSGEILAQGLILPNDENLGLWDFVILKRQPFCGGLIDYFGNEKMLRLLFDCTQLPQNFEGEAMIGYVEEYYFAGTNDVYYFSAVVLEEDFLFLLEFEQMMESLVIWEEGR